MTFDEIRNQLIVTWGLLPDVAYKMAFWLGILSLLGVNWHINSGRRTHEQQRALRDEGAGVARQSWHTEGRALDVTIAEQGRMWADWIARALGMRTGSSFSDPEPWHYDIPGSKPPTPSW